MAVAELRRKAADAELARFILKMTQKERAELSDDAWEMHNSVGELKISKVHWIAHITALVQSNCNNGCNRLWLKCTLDV